ncbi:hemerythrin family protein [Terasakiella sp. SH-1]|uniref:hemerythrin family protein n=1 Tax=Terasakiella sp. SH-1 TaxID=2560057 RepID=UPI0010748DD2|nr:hemerythrin family protein [Terasakiella sp. SH-1]
MKKIVWNGKKYDIGDDALNRQNQRVADIINLCLHNPELLEDADYRANVIGELMEYSADYLSYKENLLKDIGCIALMNHSKLHWRYLEELSSLASRIEKQESEFALELMEFLSYWWSKQILIEEMKCRGCIQAGEKVTLDQNCNIGSQEESAFSPHTSVEHAIYRSIIDKISK